jgi:hypothetical protein
MMMGIGNTQAIGSQKTHAVAVGYRQQFFFKRNPLSADFFKATGYHDGMFDAFFAAFFHDLRHDGSGQYQHCQIGYFRQFCHPLIGFKI